MYLKSIEIHGFKSFANKIVLDFHKGITGIVGPNGSGKSNIADAVRWVLGEQSAKQLRGSSMQDVIFAGTENRKPLSYAYVAITLDNADHVLPVDYEEVTVARRVYRSGESEYLLNGTACRLKDVNELFYDTGIGKEGYSIIGQGQIEKILSGKPEERRELFDEAVGIVKYKQRKKVTLRKLEDERENLVRVNDILTELERQVGPLEKQSETARRYLAAREELKTYDVNMFLIEVRRIKDQISDLTQKYVDTEAEMKEDQLQAEKMKSQYAVMEEELKAMDSGMEEIRSQLNDNQITRTRLENQINILKEQIHSAETSDADIAERIGILEADKDSHEKELTAQQEQRDALNESLAAARARLAEAREKYQILQDNVHEANQTIEADQAELLKLMDEKAELGAREQRYQTMLEQISIRKSKLTQRMLERQTEEGNLTSMLDDANAAYSNAVTRQNELEETKKTLSSRNVEWHEKKQKARASLEENTALFHKKNSRLESLRNIAERYDGYGNSIRRVMEQKKSNPGILGVVSDLIHVDQKYETAIETALGGNIQNIVTDGEDTAKEMVRFLKDNRYGRATFLPLTSVDGKNGPKDRSILNESGVLGLASELVKADHRYSGVVRYLLGRVIVCDTIDHAIHLARANHYSLHIVTLEGEYLSPGGSISGGRFKNNSNLLGRNREIAGLEEEVRTIRETIADASHRIEDVDTAIALLDDDRKENQKALEQAVLSVNTARMNLSQIQERARNSEQAYASLRSENDAIEKQIREVHDGQAELVKDHENHEKRTGELQDEIASLTEKIQSVSGNLDETSKAVSEVQIEEASVRQKVEFVEENIIRIQNEIAKDKDSIRKLDSQTHIAREDALRKKKDISRIEETIRCADAEQQRLSQELEMRSSGREALNNRYKGGFDEREKLSARINALDKELYRLDSQRQKAKEALEYQNNYMWQEYELTLHAAMELQNPDLKDRSVIRRRITELKDEIRSMGNINVNAIEQYKEVHERYQFLKTQHDDLVEGEQQLTGIIDDLDEGMRKQFRSGFADIQREFDLAFGQLFGGGHGTLELTEGEDVLESGIRIIAQPPGKKLQNMMQLSGGEKSLTAIALLFAIQHLKPSPFCLLDEIEAALDDSNVDRFARYLHKLTEHTQFIVITHRRGTMNAADRLYGITMQEKGISTLVSVNLIEADLDN